MSDRRLLCVSDAVRAVLDAVRPPKVVTLPIHLAAGLRLSEDVRSDMDMPPFARSMMDGYAVRSGDVAEVPTELDVVETIFAGQVPREALGAGQAAKIMTGAPLPDGADAVVMVERTEPLPGDRVRVLSSVPPGRHTSPKGEDVRSGDVVLKRGTRIGPAAAAVLAAVGRVRAPVFEPPKAAVLTTGDEVVPPGERPGPGRIRNSNSTGLLARLTRDRVPAVDLGIARDELEPLRLAIRRALGERDLMILTGGVSMGDRDLVAEALSLEGVEQIFHRVAIRPGKPVWFGKGRGTLVFGLPGNPVSAAVTYEILVRPAVRKLSGARTLVRPRVRAIFDSEAPRAMDREQYLPAVLGFDGLRTRVDLLSWCGSADQFRFAGANALVVVPAGGPPPESGGEVDVVPLSDEPDDFFAAGLGGPRAG